MLELGLELYLAGLDLDLRLDFELGLVLELVRLDLELGFELS